MSLTPEQLDRLGRARHRQGGLVGGQRSQRLGEEQLGLPGLREGLVRESFTQDLDSLLGQTGGEKRLAPVEDESMPVPAQDGVLVCFIVVELQRPRQVALAEGDPPAVVQRHQRLRDLALVPEDAPRVTDRVSGLLALAQRERHRPISVEGPGFPDGFAAGT